VRRFLQSVSSTAADSQNGRRLVSSAWSRRGPNLGNGDAVAPREIQEQQGAEGLVLGCLGVIAPSSQLQDQI
jgi:hypothetical protein